MTERLRTLFAARGLQYDPHPEVVPNSMRALRLTELARDLGRHDEVHARLMDATWAEARDIGDADELRTLARELGLPETEVEDVLGGDRYRERVAASTQEALSIGVTGVPGFLLEGRLLVLGAQPDEVFESAFAQLAGAGGGPPE